MTIEIPSVNILHSDEETPNYGKLHLHDSGESLYINILAGDKSSAIILDKPELEQLRNALSCFIDSELIHEVTEN